MVAGPDEASTPEHNRGEARLPVDPSSLFGGLAVEDSLYDRLILGNDSPFFRFCNKHGYPDPETIPPHRIREAFQQREELEIEYHRKLSRIVSNQFFPDSTLARHTDCFGRDLRISDTNMAFLVDMRLRSQILSERLGGIDFSAVSSSRGDLQVSPWNSVLMVEAPIMPTEEAQVRTVPIFGNDKFSASRSINLILNEITTESPKPGILKDIYQEALLAALDRIGGSNSELEVARITRTSVVGNEIVVRLCGCYYEVRFGVASDVGPDSLGQLFCVITKRNQDIGVSKSVTAFLLTDNNMLLPEPVFGQGIDSTD